MPFSIHERDLRALIIEALNNAYKVLGVSPGASHDEIKAAYKRLAVELHPDRNKSPDATARMAKANVAKTILLDPEKRARYDRIGDRTIDYDEPTKTGTASTSKSAGNTPGSWRAQAEAEKQAWHAEQEKARKERQKRYQQRADAEDREWREQKAKRRNEQRKQDERLYYTFMRGTSNKFWWIERPKHSSTNSGFWTVTVGWGRIGSDGQTKTQTFSSKERAESFFYRMVDSKQAKGYIRDLGYVKPGEKSTNVPPPKAAPNKPPASKQKTPPQPTGKQYKVYGKNGPASVHTRVKGKAYGPTKQSRFNRGDQVYVGVGSDGRASVNDPNDQNYTQTWDFVPENLQRLVNKIVIDVIAENVARAGKGSLY